MIATRQQFTEALQKALDAFEAIEWMAEQWAEGGGSQGPEAHTLEAAQHVIAGLRPFLYEQQRALHQR